MVEKIYNESSYNILTDILLKVFGEVTEVTLRKRITEEQYFQAIGTIKLDFEKKLNEANTLQKSYAKSGDLDIKIKEDNAFNALRGYREYFGSYPKLEVGYILERARIAFQDRREPGKKKTAIIRQIRQFMYELDRFHNSKEEKLSAKKKFDENYYSILTGASLKVWNRNVIY